MGWEYIQSPDYDVPESTIIADSSQEKLQNNSGVTAIPGNVVCLRTDGRFNLASMYNFSRADAIGLAAEIIPHGSVGSIQLSKFLVTAAANWTLITGGALIPGSVYYLGSYMGQMTNIPPTSGFLVRIGIAVNATTFLIRPDDPIEL